MNRIKSFFGKHYYSAVFFAFIMLYNAVITGGFRSLEIHEIAYSFHLVDYSMGFCSRFLPGAVYNFLFDSTSRTAVFIYSLTLFAVFILIISVLLEKLMLKTDVKNRKLLLLIIAFFLTGPSTFSVYSFMLGSLDNYWLYLSVIFLLLMSDKRFYPLIIPVSVLTAAVHYPSIIAFIPFCLLLMLYKLSLTQNKKEKALLWSVIIVSGASALALTAYFMMFEHENLTYTAEEFVEILKNRGLTEEPTYFTTSLYEQDRYGLFDEEYFSSISSPLEYALAFLVYRVKVNFQILPVKKCIIPLLLDAPAAVFIFASLRQLLKEKKGSKLRTFTFFAICSMFFVTIIISLFLSTDTVRFIGHAFTLLFASFLYVSYAENECMSECLKKITDKIPKTIIIFYLAVYALTVSDPI